MCRMNTRKPSCQPLQVSVRFQHERQEGSWLLTSNAAWWSLACQWASWAVWSHWCRLTWWQDPHASGRPLLGHKSESPHPQPCIPAQVELVVMPVLFDIRSKAFNIVCTLHIKRFRTTLSLCKETQVSAQAYRVTKSIEYVWYTWRYTNSQQKAAIQCHCLFLREEGL